MTRAPNKIRLYEFVTELTTGNDSSTSVLVHRGLGRTNSRTYGSQKGQPCARLSFFDHRLYAVRTASAYRSLAVRSLLVGVGECRLYLYRISFYY